MFTEIVSTRHCPSVVSTAICRGPGSGDSDCRGVRALQILMKEGCGLIPACRTLGNFWSMRGRIGGHVFAVGIRSTNFRSRACRALCIRSRIQAVGCE